MIDPFLNKHGDLQKVQGGRCMSCSAEILHLVAKVMEMFVIFGGANKMGLMRQFIYEEIDAHYSKKH